MKEMNQVSIYRLNMILTLFQAKRACYSVNELAEFLNIPVSVVRKDLLMLHNNREFGTTFYPAEDMEEEEAEEFIKRLEQGQADDMPLTAETQYRNDVYLALSQLELTCLDDFLDSEKSLGNQGHRNYVIKPMYNQARANMQVKVAELNEMIQAGETIRMTYRTKEKALVTSVIRPLELVHNAMDDLYYVVTIEQGRLLPFRLDRICNFEVSKEKITIDDLSPLEQLPRIWGMEMGEPVHVKIKILNEANVQHKVKRDLAPRIYGKWEQKDDILYFEDDVIGINHFRTWLHSYGSSVLVLEPATLREEIIESARKRRSYYQ